jgi:hypothetical protein
MPLLAERDLLAPTIQTSSRFGMFKSAALKQYRIAQRIQLNLTIFESPRQRVFFDIEFQLGFGGAAPCCFGPPATEATITKEWFWTAISDSSSIEATMQTHPF